jgi:ferric-dicitrate binding protein FerR (iron transport regulator)
VERPDEVLYNTLTTPRGGQYQLTFPDGSRVWLDAASSIKYPTAFTGKVREVEMTGEAYFEIAKNTRMPFVVKAGGTTTTVLGTHFNINAYDDERTLITTLLEGSVKFGCGKEEKVLHPGQQAVLNAETRSFTVKDADTYQAVAWKNGQFDFDDKDLPAIMRQISRWYNIDINFQSTYDGATFGGGISRQLNLSHVLRLLDKSGVHTRLEDHKLIILP